MRKLRVSPDLALPLSAVTETFGILAVRGSGKTNTARVMAEEMFYAGLPFVAVDPVGAWWGLRSSRDGSGPGIAVPIFGGRHGDVPLERTGGALMADVIVDQRLSCVVDVSAFDSEAAKKQFLLEFARRLYQRNEQPLHLFLEEADDYLPQRPMRDEAQLLRAWENIVRRGRQRGLGITLITQRSASVNKSVLTQVQTLVAMRTTGPQDRRAIEEWLRYHDQEQEIVASLPKLADGEAWVWSPNFLEQTKRVKFRLSRTLDSGATPKMGRGRAQKVATLADVDLDDIKKRMTETIERAKSEDPRELRKKITELEAAMRKLRDTEGKLAPPQPVEVPVFDEIGYKDLKHNLESVVRASIEAVKTGFDAALNDYRQRCLVNVKSAVETRGERARQRSREAWKNWTEKDVDEEVKPWPTNGQKLSRCARMLLTALVQRSPETSTASQIAIMSGYSVKSSGFDNAVSELRVAGLLDGPRIALRATQSGLDASPGVVELPRGEALVNFWMGKLGKCERSLLKVLVNAHPKALTKEELSERSGYSSASSGFDNAVSKLRTLKLIRGERGAPLVASEEFFV